MTLREWAEREGIGFFYVPIEGDRSIEYDSTEAVIDVNHCWDCGLWYVRRGRDGRLFRTGPSFGDSTEQPISEEELVATTIRHWMVWRDKT